jgi:uncharacterized protein YdeI (YjbR/CyaY-like superfamily)
VERVLAGARCAIDPKVRSHLRSRPLAVLLDCTILRAGSPVRSEERFFMAAVVPDPSSILAFASAHAFEDWLSKHHDRETEIYLRLYKKGSGVASVTHAEALDVALCWGWIDAIRKSYDEQSFLQRFTRRKPKSIWSQINREHVARLIAAGRMTPHGLAQVEAARADGRWDAAYASSSKMTMPDDLMAAIEQSPKALSAYQTLNAVNRYALAFRLGIIKTPAVRVRKIESYVAMLERGELLHAKPTPTKSSRKPK